MARSRRSWTPILLEMNSHVVRGTCERCIFWSPLPLFYKLNILNISSYNRRHATHPSQPKSTPLPHFLNPNIPTMFKRRSQSSRSQDYSGSGRASPAPLAWALGPNGKPYPQHWRSTLPAYMETPADGSAAWSERSVFPMSLDTDMWPKSPSQSPFGSPATNPLNQIGSPVPESGAVFQWETSVSDSSRSNSHASSSQQQRSGTRSPQGITVSRQPSQLDFGSPSAFTCTRQPGVP